MNLGSNEWILAKSPSSQVTGLTQGPGLCLWQEGTWIGRGLEAGSWVGREKVLI